MNTKEIQVIATDVETGKVIAYWVTPANGLPESIEEGLELSIKDDDWQVVKATPNTSAQYIEKGAVKLILRKIDRNSKTRTQIHVTLVDADTDNVFGQMMSYADEMPQVIEPHETTLNLEGIPWVIVKAEPSTANEYIKAGRLTVTLKKITHTSPNNILASLPTLCESIPEVQPINRERDTSYLPVAAHPASNPSEKTRQDDVTVVRPINAQPEGNIYRIHEDYWRQIELISGGYEKDIEAEMDEIRIIYQDYSVENKGIFGFRKIHMRKRIQEPIKKPIKLDTVLSLLPEGSHQYDGIGYGGIGSMEADGLIEDGFAFQVGPVVIYGQYDDTAVKVICIHDAGNKTIPSQEITNFLSQVMVLGDFYLVDWIKGTVLTSDIISIQDYLNQYFYKEHTA